MADDPGQVVERLAPVLAHEGGQGPGQVHLVHVLHRQEPEELVVARRGEGLFQVGKTLPED